LSGAASILPYQAHAQAQPAAATQAALQSVIPAIPQAGTWLVDVSGIRATNVNLALETLAGVVLAQKTVNVSNNQTVTLYGADFVDQNGQPLPPQNERLVMTGDDLFVDHFTYRETAPSPSATASAAARDDRTGDVFPGMIHHPPTPIRHVLAQRRYHPHLAAQAAQASAEPSVTRGFSIAGVPYYGAGIAFSSTTPGTTLALAAQNAGNATLMIGQQNATTPSLDTIVQSFATNQSRLLPVTSLFSASTLATSTIGSVTSASGIAGMTITHATDGSIYADSLRAEEASRQKFLIHLFVNDPNGWEASVDFKNGTGQTLHTFIIPYDANGNAFTDSSGNTRFVRYDLAPGEASYTTETLFAGFNGIEQVCSAEVRANIDVPMNDAPGDGTPLDGRFHIFQSYTLQGQRIGFAAPGQLDAGRSVSAVGIEEIVGWSATGQAVYNPGAKPVTVRVDGRDATGKVIATANYTLNAHQQNVADTASFFPGVDPLTIMSIVRVDHTVTGGAADGRIDGSDAFGGRIIGFRVDGLDGAEGPALLTGALMQNTDALATLVETSDFMPNPNRADLYPAIYRDGPGLVDMTAISNTTALVNSMSYNPLGTGVNPYSFTGAAATPSRVLHVEGLTATRINSSDFAFPSSGTANAPNSRSYNPLVQVNFADGTNAQQKTQLTVYEGTLWDMNVIYPTTWRNIIQQPAVATRLGQLFCYFDYYPTPLFAPNVTTASAVTTWLLGVTDGGTDPIYSNLQASNLAFYDEGRYTRLLLDMSSTSFGGILFSDMTSEALMRTFMNTLGLGPEAVNKY
jgi:hypothetical protein